MNPRFSTIICIFLAILLIGCNDKIDKKAPEVDTPHQSEEVKSILDLTDQESFGNSFKKLENFQYDSLTGLDLLNLERLLTDKSINATSPNNNQLTNGSIVIYKTSKRLIGKLQILEYKADIRFKAVTYLRDGSKAYQIVKGITLKPGTSFDLDEVIMTIKDRDFSWDFLPGNRWILSPKNRSKYYVQTKK